jgi:hypothetical protein
MLRQAVRNLDDRFGLLSRKPAVNKQINAIGRGQRESRSLAHCSFAIIKLRVWPNQATPNSAVDKKRPEQRAYSGELILVRDYWPRQAGGTSLQSPLMTLQATGS